MMKKIFIALPPVFPVPAVGGGAVETLVEMLIEENEKHPKFYFTIFSTYNKEAQTKSLKYKYTRVIYIRNGTRISQIKYFLSRIVRKLTGNRPMILDDYHRKLYQFIKEETPDFFLVEGGTFLREYRKVSQLLGANKMAVHIHSNLIPDASADTIFGTAIAISDYVGKTWKQNYAGNVMVLKNGINREEFVHPLNIEMLKKVRKELECQEDDFIILYCGRLIPEKGIKELVEAVVGIPDKKVKLLVIGSVDFSNPKKSDYVKEIYHLARDCERIKFLGYIHNSRLPVYYQLATIQAVPSICEEGAGLVLLEGMSSGKAIIYTDSGGMPEYIKSHGGIKIDREGIVENLKQSILYLKENPLERSRMEACNQQTSKEFDSESYFKNFQRAMNSIIGGRDFEDNN